MFSKKYTFPSIVLFILCALLLIPISCGGVSDHQIGPEMNPLSFLVGPAKGYRVIRDRNLNIKAVADVNRNCTALSELEGECEDTVIFFGSQETAREVLKYSIFYDENLKLHLKIKTGAGFLEGFTYGSGIYLAGKLPIPLKKDKLLTVETRWDRISIAEDNMSMQRDTYYFFGIYSGTVETIWQK